MNKKGNLIQKIDKPTFLLPAILLVIAVAIGVAAPDAFGAATNWAFKFTTTNFSWLYAIGGSLLVIFCLWAGFSKYGNIKLGGKDAEPEMSFFSWFAIALTSGIAIGIVYWGVAEPIYNLTSPPGFTGWEANSPDAAEGALKYVFLHWGLHPYSIYTAAGLCCAFMFWNGKRKFQVSSSLYPLMGDKADGIWGKLINSLCIFAIIGGIGTSLGFGVSQVSTGINYVFGTNFTDTALAAFVIGGMAVFYITAACTGLHKGIKLVSSANMYIYFALMIWAFIFGGTLFILNNTSTAVGQYLALIVPQSFYLEPVKQTGWVGGWTIFYWAWWFSFAPIVGLFLIKLAKGRTIRQFVLVNMIAPTIFAIAWFGIFGSSAMKFELSGISIAAELAEWGSSAALFAYVKHLPLTPFLYVLVFGAIVFSFVTLAESMTLTIADMTTKEEYLVEGEEQSSPILLKVFWGVLMGLIAFTLLFSGGLSALQTASIVCGLPILVLQLFMAAAYIKSMKNHSIYDMTLTDEERAEITANKE